MGTGTSAGSPPACYRNAELAEQRFGDLARRYALALNEVDEPAATALDALDALGADGVAMLGAALAEGRAAVPDAPAELRAYLDELHAPPFEVDHELIDVGARALLRHAVGYAGATRQSLLWGYVNGAAIKPLAWTGEMRTSAVALGRLLETGEWLQAVITPGALRPHAEGWQATARVRLLHARIRAGLWKSGRWDAAAWGAPLNVADSAFTLLEFTVMPLRMLRRLGLRYTAREVDGIFALWRLVGHLVGVPPELNPDGETESERLLELRELTVGPPDSDSVELVRALLDGNLQPDGTALQRATGRALEAFDRALAWASLPPGYCERLAIPPTPVTRMLPALAGGFRVLEAVRRRTPGADDWLAARNRTLIRQGEGMLRQRVSMSDRTGHGGRRKQAAFRRHG